MKLLNELISKTSELEDVSVEFKVGKEWER